MERKPVFILTFIEKKIHMIDIPVMEAQYGIPITVDRATLGV